VLGRDVESVVKKFLTGMPGKFDVARENVALEGLLIDVDEKTGKARSVRRVREKIEPCA
jgi:hypothetical protein